MAAHDAALCATAGGLLQWHRRTAHDPSTGLAVHATQGGHARRSAHADHRALYPRIDPAVIVLVTCGEWALLGRKAAWEAGRYSCLAGFCEVGEALEQAVAREVAEEAGVVVDHRDVTYHSSQPWPFPSSLMVGFTATTAAKEPPRHGYGWLGGEGEEAARAVGVSEEEVHAAHAAAWLPAVQADEDELQDARWFHRDTLRDMVLGASPLRIPQPYALAHRIVGSWLADEQRAVDAVPTVRIDDGVFKYILARVRCTASGATKLVVRGDVRAGYHDHLLGHLRAEARAAGLEVDVCGGGRIEHHAGVMQVYGYSSAFGAAPHEVTKALLHRAMAVYADDSIVTSYQGY